MSVKLIDRERRQLVTAARTAFTAVAFLWLFHVLRWLFGAQAADFGIVPRSLGGLPGILTGPLVHGDLGHLANNSVPILATVFLLTYFYRRIAARAILILYIVTGALVWLFGRGAGWGADVGISHVGASGVAYALVAFLFWMGVFRRSIQSIIVALILLLYFSGMIAGVLPDQLNVSWESHLIGGLVGIAVAWRFRASEAAHELAPPPPAALEARPYFPADIFAYTLDEREAIRRAEIEAARQAEMERAFAAMREAERRREGDILDRN